MSKNIPESLRKAVRTALIIGVNTAVAQRQTLLFGINLTILLAENIKEKQLLIILPTLAHFAITPKVATLPIYLKKTVRSFVCLIHVKTIGLLIFTLKIAKFYPKPILVRQLLSY